MLSLYLLHIALLVSLLVLRVQILAASKVAIETVLLIANTENIPPPFIFHLGVVFLPKSVKLCILVLIL